MKIIFYEKGADLDAWLGGLRRELPDADLRVWEPGDTAPADYAIVWRAPRELFANRPDLKAVFNLGAGVDAILDVERKEPGTLPPNAKLVRLEDTGMARQMVEYATYCVLRYLRRFDEYDALQRERRWEKLPQHARESFTVGGVFVSWLTLITIVVTAALLLALALFLRGTAMGMRMRAAAEDFDAARLCAVDANRVVAVAFGLSGLLAGAAALLVVGQTGTIFPTMGLTAVLFGFTAAVIGGMGSRVGAVRGG